MSASRTSATPPGAPPTAPGGTARLREVARDLGTDHEWITYISNAIAEAIHEQIPELGEDADMRAATFASTESNVRQFLDLVSNGIDPAEGQLGPAAIEYMRELIRRGIPIDALLLIYHVGHSEFVSGFGERLGAGIDDPATRADAFQAGAVMSFDYISAVSRELARRYAKERDRWVRSAAAVRAEVVRALLADEAVDVARASARLGYELDRAHLGFVIWADPAAGGDEDASDDLGSVEHAASELATALGTSRPLLVPLGARLVAGWVGGHGGLDEVDAEDLRIDPGPIRCRGAVGEPGEGVAGFARSHRQARLAQRVAQLSDAQPGAIASYSRTALTALASADLDHAREFVRSELGPLAGDDGKALRLAETLRAYLEHGSKPGRAAERLGVHINTIANRLRAIEELLGHPIEPRATELLVALRLAPLLRASARR